MAYTIKLTSSADTINADGDTLQYIMTFDVDATGSNKSYTFKEKNLIITNHGKLKWEYDIENAFLVPGSMNITISDTDEYLNDLFFGSTAAQIATDKQAEVEIRLNGVIEFFGVIVEDSIQYNVDDFLMSLQVTPRTDILNKTMLYDGTLPLDPFDRTSRASYYLDGATYYSSGTVRVSYTDDTGVGTGTIVKIENVEGMTDLNGVFEVTDHSAYYKWFEVSLVTDQTYTTPASTATRTVLEAETWANSPKFTEILEYIYQSVDSSISYSGGTLEINHDWKFISQASWDAVEISNATYAANVVTVTHTAAAGIGVGDTVIIKDVLGMTDLNAVFIVATAPDTVTFTVALTTAQTYTNGGLIYDGADTDYDLEDLYLYEGLSFFDSTTGLSTVGDLLRNYGKSFFAYTGMIHEKKAFFNKLFYYDSTNIQTLGTVLSISKRAEYALLDYTKFSTTKGNTRSYAAGTFTELDGRFVLIDDLATAFYGDTTGSYTSMRVGAKGIWNAKDDLVDSETSGWRSNLNLLAQLWFNYRGNINNARTYIFIVDGVNYDFLKSFNYDGYKYQIIGMEKDWEKNKTEIEALYLGAL